MTGKSRMSRAAMAAMFFASAPAVAAAQPAMPPHPHILSVSGEGEVRAVEARIQFRDAYTHLPAGEGHKNEMSAGWSDRFAWVSLNVIPAQAGIQAGTGQSPVEWLGSNAKWPGQARPFRDNYLSERNRITKRDHDPGDCVRRRDAS